MASLNEFCTPTAAGCPPLFLASRANDWVHGNALQFTADGNIILSSRHQDWIIKIDYSEGTGNILWRLGNHGDFQMNASDPSPWFSHQHDPEFAAGDGSILTVFDDGNLRQAVNSKAHSRGQVLQINERDMTASLVLNVDLGGFSFALGATEQLPDGNYFFGAGWLVDNTCKAMVVDSSGNSLYAIQTNEPEFRSFRMRDLYTP
jgi:arylsulfate sulfotransferase